MKRQYHTFTVNNTSAIKQQMLSWINRFSICCFLDNHDYRLPYHSLECVAAAGAFQTFEPANNFFASLSRFTQLRNDWIFGHFNYDIKNKIEPGLTSENPEATLFPDCFLFVPEVLLQLRDDRLTIGVFNQNPNEILKAILAETIGDDAIPRLQLQPSISREAYLENVLQLQKHIHHGDCYEINYCQHFFATADLNPLAVYRKLSKISPNPFSAFYKLSDKYLLCASPERYVKKTGSKLISQPMKGTAPRDHQDPAKDQNNQKQLFESIKDRTENVMVVDLVRNDLSKICGVENVVVEELYGVYPFPNVHQMVSTVTGVLPEHVGFAEVLKATFPMGSMTGVPKKRVMELIEKYEPVKRGIYSGSVGYITPSKDFDFNVVIRSLVYNESSGNLSFHAGSAITSFSNPAEEYDECLLKGKAIAKVFSGEIKKE